MAANPKPEDREWVRKRLAELRPVIAKAVVGDFSKNITIPKKEDEFTELFVGVQTMVEVIREQLQELRNLNTSLEAKAAEKNTALEEAQALTHLGSWQWDIATNVISWSDELYRIYGLKPQERQISYDEFLHLIHPDDRDKVGEIVGYSFKTGEPFEFEHRIILPNGKQRTLFGMGKVIVDSSGQPIRMVGTSQDITERKKAELALQRSDKRFKTVTRATHDLVYDLDLHKGTMWFNEVLFNDYGYSKQKVENTLEWWTRHIHSDDVLEVEAQISKLLESTQQTWDAQYRFQKADGNYVVARNRAFVLRDSAGRPERIIGSLLDITGQKQLERAKDEFLSLVSHQLRTPLTVTRLYGEMLANGMAGELTEQQMDYVSRITHASVRMIKLVSDILNISRIELDRVKVRPVPTDINTLIRMHLNEVKMLAKEKEVDLKFTPDPKLPSVTIDTDVFNLILENLLMNAVRYTRPSKGLVQVRFKKNKGGYLLEVSDNGIGIPAAAHPHIFGRFYRAENAKNFDSEGTGLGLYLIRLICDTIGADAWFESTKNKGTIFYVQFPSEGMEAKQGKLALE